MKGDQLKKILAALLIAIWGVGIDVIQPCFAAVWLNPQLIVETEWLEKNLQNPNVVVIHIAPNKDLYAKGHIPGAGFIHYNSIVKQTGQGIRQVPPPGEMADLLQSAGINQDSRIVISYESIPWVRTIADATRLFWNLEYLGHDKVAILNGGLEKWLQERRPTTANPPTPKKGNFTPREFNSQNILDMAGMEKRIGRPDVLILDTRSDIEYFGISLRQPDSIRRGHIPGARLFPWLYYFQENPRGVWVVRPVKEIEEMHRSMGIGKEKEIALYCNSGHLCTANYWVLRLMGFSNVRVYIGSMAEWSPYSDQEAPLTRYKFE